MDASNKKIPIIICQKALPVQIALYQKARLVKNLFTSDIADMTMLFTRLQLKMYRQ